MMDLKELKTLASEYIKEEYADTVEITAFVEWIYRKNGFEVENLEMMEELEGGLNG